MPEAIYVPRVNNNDDSVTLRSLDVSVGDKITAGDTIAAVETDKAVIDVECEKDGFVLEVLGSEGDSATVGSVLMWIGQSADEKIPTQSMPSAPTSATTIASPTAKAKLLLDEYGLDAAAILHTGKRLSAADVQAHIDQHGISSGDKKQQRPVLTDLTPEPTAAGTKTAMSSQQRGMLHTVTWHRDHAVTGYIELEYDVAPWDTYAKQYAEKHNLMLSPLLSLMALRLVEVTTQTPILNTTVYENQLYSYDNVNLGFTVQVGDMLYLPVIHEAEKLESKDFVNKMGALQRRATGHKLSPSELQGATVSFSSMARWQVKRHIPILPPYSSIIIAHTATSDGTSILGATYDHRILSGADVTIALRSLSQPPTD